MLRLAISVLPILVITSAAAMLAPLPAFAKFDPNNPDALRAECDRLDISPKNCTEQAILESLRFRQAHKEIVETIVTPILVGLGAAFVFAILALNKISHTQTIGSTK